MSVLNQQIQLPLLSDKQLSLHIKREDLLHPHISGNKYRKLKYNIIAAQKSGFDSLLTFGGAYSNHLAATAYTGKEYGFKTIGVIRGEEIKSKWRKNPTLSQAYDFGMRFHFVSREVYRQKENVNFLNDLEQRFGKNYVLPEGGTNSLAVKGCEEILTKEDKEFDVICCSVGTGGTVAGIVNASCPEQRVLGFSALAGNFLKEDIRRFARNNNWELANEYNFGGYAKVNEELIGFINNFKSNTQVPLDPIYTGKMIYGILDLAKKGYFRPGTKILAVHTGGLQGITGMNLNLKKKNLPLISI
ncbi:1-aminocyclopropane-1-carboxylate deaminase/D-cysteine desulfhydrase [Spongiimicrobium sp. 3-5]|uniref:1-aminocyclopropane-1-carboxylate deaminase/D-cysteine desulfhydrase n=1 Tax=Spongiimicrobium sp. 3-5 TaxID=3332596 RepID=UPI0039807510